MAEPDARLLDQRIDVALDKRFSSGGGGGYTSGMEPRVARLEASASHLERDVADIKIDLRDFKKEAREELKGMQGEFKGVRAEMRSDFRLTWAGLIASVLALAGLMAKGFHWL